MKYYRLWVYNSNPVGAEFAVCTEEEFDDFYQKFYDGFEEISEQDYKDEIKRNKDRAYFLMTGHYPDEHTLSDDLLNNDWED